MKSLYSSIFGRILGNSTTVSIETNCLTVIVKNQPTKIQWMDLISPPLFSLSLLGQTMTFSTAKQHYVLSKLAFSSERKLKTHCEKLWIEANKKHLETLLMKIEQFINKRYLRQSGLQRFQKAIQKEYVRWFPWAESSGALGEMADLTLLLKNYRHWQEQELIACRERYIDKQLVAYKTFFDTIESNPLTLNQRRACIVDDDNNLLLAGAGTGKTSVMVGRAGYLLNSEQASHNEILLLAYGRKAADEMDQRIKEKLATDKISATTFHSLGLYIIAQVEGAKPCLSIFAEDEKAKSKWVQAYFEHLIKHSQQYRRLVLTYFSKYYYVEKNEFKFDNLGDYYQYLTDNDIRSLKGDRVKSFGELIISNWLYHHGIEYIYEAKYAFDVKTIERKQYQPDFFLPELNLYIEYFGIDENGDTAPYIDKAEYHASMQWKRQTHQDYKTDCIELTYALHKNDMLLNTLEKALKDKSVSYEMLADDIMLASIKETGRITVLAEMFSKLVGLYKAACLDETLEKGVVVASIDPKQTSKAFELLRPILKTYQATLLSRDEIDFEDMITKALDYIETGKFNSPWSYIMVDEFQDISEPRARLVRSLRDNHKNSSVFAVGDDWQAIYRFSGADVCLTTGFEAYFGPTTQCKLDKTFRFNNRIGQVATDFVSKNPFQINKTVHSHQQVSKPAVSILRKGSIVSAAQGKKLMSKIVNKVADKVIDEIANGAIDDVLTAITNRVNKPVTVYLLARFWFQLPNKATVASLRSQYPMLDIQTQSFHASKGKEADYVVIMGLKTGKHGFPSNKATAQVIDALLAKEEEFAHAEERRLFYVGLTRAKDRVYIIADMLEVSPFVKELIKDYDVECNEFGIKVNQVLVDQIKCLVCETGTLKARAGQHGAFYSCSHFPLCDHKERACAKCDDVMTRSKYPGFKSCLNPACNDILPLCNKCGAEMVLRKSNKGEFWGCRNFRGNEPLSCKNGIDKLAIKWPHVLSS
jgi:DNA helicase-4